MPMVLHFFLKNKTSLIKDLKLLDRFPKVPAFFIEQLNIIKKTLFGNKKSQNKRSYFTKFLRIRWCSGFWYILQRKYF